MPQLHREIAGGRLGCGFGVGKLRLGDSGFEAAEGGYVVVLEFVVAVWGSAQVDAAGGALEAGSKIASMGWLKRRAILQARVTHS